MHLNDGLACCERLTAIPCHHEQAAAIAAEAYGRVHPCGIGVAMVTSGPGATNAITAVAGAWIESVPLLIISGQVKRADMLRGNLCDRWEFRKWKSFQWSRKLLNIQKP